MQFWKIPGKVGKTVQHLFSRSLHVFRWRVQRGSTLAGYLPGMMLPHIKFFGGMSLLYIVLGVVWAGLYARYWKEVFTLQHCISAVLALGMMEMSTW